MDTNYFGFREEPTQPQLVLNDYGKSYMAETARWGKFLGIIYTLLLLLACCLMPFLMRQAMIQNPMLQQGNAAASIATGAVIFYALFAIGINAYPLFALLKFSTLTKSSIKEMNQEKFDAALRYQKGLYKYLGILTIIIISFYGLIAIFALTIGITAMAA